MSNAIKSFVLFLLRFALLWLIDAVSLFLTSTIIPGITLEAVGATPVSRVAISAAFMLAIVNLLVRPVILLLARPLGWIALLVVGFLVNAAALWITAALMAGFTVTLPGALLGGFVFAIFNAIFTGILELDEEGSFYQGRIERQARAKPFDSAREPGRGLMMLEIDGLSYWTVREALERKLMPTLQKMIDEEGYVLSLTDCGLPSMTSACQAGIMFGDNDDIPAYRWYDKTQQRLYVSNSDATELNARYARGQGLMRAGSSIMNMFDGDAEKSMFTMANLFAAGDAEKSRRADDVALLMLDPYFLMRTVSIFFWEVLRELWEAWQQQRKNVWPRLNRLEHGYPFLRAAMCVLMRDISTNLAILDMMRGAPSIYMLYLGYDEVAHHSGPWTSDAFGDLKRLDKTIARLRRVVKEKAPRPYDLIILSDHGQSFGPTFKQRYGLTIKEFIEQQLPQGVSVAQSIGGDTGAVGLHSVAGELANVSTAGAGGAVGNAVAKRGQKLAAAGARAGGPAVDESPAAVTAYGSGNAAQVYFDLFPRKVTLSELNAAYPGMVNALVQHEGLGLVLGYADDMTAVALGKGGQRNLHTGEVIGADPVAPYAPATGHGAASIEKRVWQLRRVMDFKHAGDLWLISTWYPDGTVAALEELIGNHGGLGGEQTDAMIFHPPDMAVPDTRNAIDVYHILNNRRGAPITEQPVIADPVASDWSPAMLAAGIGRVSTWLGRALRCMVLDPVAYKEVVADPYMTGPALLITLTVFVLEWLTVGRGIDAVQLLYGLIFYFIGVGVVFGAGWLLTRRGNFTRTFRAMGFASAVFLLSPLQLFPPLGAAFDLVINALFFVAIWMGAAIANRVSGWRTLLLPVMAVLVIVVGSALMAMLLSGAAFTFESLFGLTPM